GRTPTPPPPASSTSGALFSSTATSLYRGTLTVDRWPVAWSSKGLNARKLTASAPVETASFAMSTYCGMAFRLSTELKRKGMPSSMQCSSASACFTKQRPRGDGELRDVDALRDGFQAEHG